MMHGRFKCSRVHCPSYDTLMVLLLLLLPLTLLPLLLMLLMMVLTMTRNERLLMLVGAAAGKFLFCCNLYHVYNVNC